MIHRVSNLTKQYFYTWYHQLARRWRCLENSIAAGCSYLWDSSNIQGFCNGCIITHQLAWFLTSTEQTVNRFELSCSKQNETVWLSFSNVTMHWECSAITLSQYLQLLHSRFHSLFLLLCVSSRLCDVDFSVS